VPVETEQAEDSESAEAGLAEDSSVVVQVPVVDTSDSNETLH